MHSGARPYYDLLSVPEVLSDWCRGQQSGIVIGGHDFLSREAGQIIKEEMVTGGEEEPPPEDPAALVFRRPPSSQPQPQS